MRFFSMFRAMQTIDFEDFQNPPPPKLEQKQNKQRKRGKQPSAVTLRISEFSSQTPAAV